MSKTWETKRRILQLLSGKSKTLEILSQELDLAPSTVSEHIEQLRNIGAVRKVDNPFIKKWKYYERNPDFDLNNFGNNTQERREDMSKSMKMAAGVGLAVLIGVIAFFAISMTATSGVPGTSTVGFLLTDPPQVPAGTTALNITYSSLQAYAAVPNNSSASGWINATGSGTLDLMTLVNVSQAIGTANIPANAEISKIRFAIANAHIVVNGTAYSVIVPSGNLTTAVAGTATSNTSILVDLSPVVVSVFTNNSAAFVLVPSVKAVFIGNVSVRPTGARIGLNRNESQRLSEIPSISITNATLSVAGNTTMLSITVKNDANESVDIQHVSLFGSGILGAGIGSNRDIADNIGAAPDIISVVSGIGTSRIGTSITANGQISSQASGHEGAGGGVQTLNNSTGMGAFGGAGEAGNWSIAMVNALGVRAHIHGGFWANATVSSTAEPFGGNLLNKTLIHTFIPFAAAVNGNFQVSQTVLGDMLGAMVFNVEPDGTLVLPVCADAGIACAANFDNGNGEGYSLAAGASATFTFSGQITYAGGRILVLPVQGSAWNIAVTGEHGAETNAKVTVT